MKEVTGKNLKQISFRSLTGPQNLFTAVALSSLLSICFVNPSDKVCFTHPWWELHVTHSSSSLCLCHGFSLPLGQTCSPQWKRGQVCIVHMTTYPAWSDGHTTGHNWAHLSTSSTSVKACVRAKHCLAERSEEKKCEKQPYRHQGGSRGRGQGAPDVGAEIPLQPLKRKHADIFHERLQPMASTYTRPGGNCEEGTAERSCCGLMTTPVPYSPLLFAGAGV